MLLELVETERDYVRDLGSVVEVRVWSQQAGVECGIRLARYLREQLMHTVLANAAEAGDV